ncbi:MAG: AI-2E family transporter [Myxococcaceae bacterium]|jgi:predicted PurR-regulated permease PerM|nr:AI-2E family transporter [Myxococcaceae bacterium]
MTLPTPSRFYARAFAVGAFLVLGWLLFRTLTPFFVPIAWATLLAFMLQPLNRRLLERWRRPALPAAALTLGMVLLVAGPVSLFLFAFLRQTSQLLARFQGDAHDRKLPALQLVLEFKPVQAALEAAKEFTSLTKEQILAQANDAAQAGLQQLASLGGTVVLGAFNIITQFALTMFLLFFFLRDGREMLQRALHLVPLQPERVRDLSKTLGGVTRGVVVGTLVTALAQGTLIGIGFAIAGLPSPLVFGAVGALASLIPVVGTSLVWVPAVLSLLALGQTGWAVFLAVWSVVLVAGSDNVIRPLVVSSSSNVSTLLVFVGVLGGVSAFGFAGLFLGPVLLTLVDALLRYADEEGVARAQPGLSPKAGSPASAGSTAEAQPAEPAAAAPTSVSGAAPHEAPPSAASKAEPS